MFGNLGYLGGSKEPFKKKVHVKQDQQGKPKISEKQQQQQSQNKPQQQQQKSQQQQQQQGNKKIQEKQQWKEKEQKSSLQTAEKQLKGSKFRLLNEFLYTENSKEAFTHFKDNQDDFTTYHEGFRSQTEGWPIKPVDLIIQELETNPFYKDGIVCDLGCGDGFIYEHFRDQNRIKVLKKYKNSEQINPNKNSLKKIFSFDLVSHKKFITACDISNIPVEGKQASACVFCLALMGINYVDFLIEATRVLKQNGKIIIAEVKSRITNVELFCCILKLLGHSIVKNQKIETQAKKQKNQNQKQQQNQQGGGNSNEFFYEIISQKSDSQVDLSQGGQTKLSKFSKKLVDKAIQIGKEQSTYKEGQQLQTLQDLAALALKPCIYKRR